MDRPYGLYDHLNKFIAVISANPLMYTSYCLVSLLKVTLSGLSPLIEAYLATDSHVFDRIPQIMLTAAPDESYLNPIRKKLSRLFLAGIFNVAPLPLLQYASAFIFKLIIFHDNKVTNIKGIIGTNWRCCIRLKSGTIIFNAHYFTASSYIPLSAA